MEKLAERLLAPLLWFASEAKQSEGLGVVDYQHPLTIFDHTDTYFPLYLNYRCAEKNIKAVHDAMPHSSAGRGLYPDVSAAQWSSTDLNATTYRSTMRTVSAPAAS